MSSTFDAIPFVRDYLQKEIEGQLRTLLMDEVPVIIHRLSQRLWVPEYRESEDAALARNTFDQTALEKPVDPLASPPQDPVDSFGNTLDPSQIAALTLDTGAETHALFSQKNLLRLGALTDSHRTLSLFTPGIRDVVFRAWAGPGEGGDTLRNGGKFSPITSSITRSQSWTGSSSTTYVFSDHGEDSQHATKPSLSRFTSATTGLGLDSTRKHHGGRKRKHRVVNLRKKAVEGDDVESVSGDSFTASGSGTMSSAQSEHDGRPKTPERGEVTTPPKTPEKLGKEPGDGTPMRMSKITPRPSTRDESMDDTPRASMYGSFGEPLHTESRTSKRPSLRPTQSLQPTRTASENPPDQARSKLPQQQPLQQTSLSPYVESPSGGMLDQAWMNKFAGEIARKVQDQKAANSGFWDNVQPIDDPPPPAYGS